MDNVDNPVGASPEIDGQLGLFDVDFVCDRCKLPAVRLPDGTARHAEAADAALCALVFPRRAATAASNVSAPATPGTTAVARGQARNRAYEARHPERKMRWPALQGARLPKADPRAGR